MHIHTFKLFEVISLTLSLPFLMTSAPADEPAWHDMPYTAHSAFQAVNAEGLGTWPLDAPVKMQGILINQAEHLVDTSPAAPGFMGGQWQIYIQAAGENDWGGTALYMGQYIGKIVGNHPAGSYDDQAWLDELDRLTHDPISGHSFEPGDRVEIRARAPGLFFRGKTNINEQHYNGPETNFDIYLIEASIGLPIPRLVTLDQLKDENDAFIFDPQREIGCERYQGTLVRINGVSCDNASQWGPGANLIVTDGDSRTFPIKLGLSEGYLTYPAPPGTFDVIGILDQEDVDGNDGYKSGYRLWIAGDYDGNGTILPASFELLGDFTNDGAIDLEDLTALVACMAGPDTAPQPDPPVTMEDCLRAFDTEQDGDIDARDTAIFQERFGLPR